MVFWLVAAGVVALAFGCATYKYKEWKLYDNTVLSAEKREIRLLEILPAKPGDSIKCKLRKTSLDSIPTNEGGAGSWNALSYCWGRSEYNDIVTINGKHVKCRKNLCGILRQLRDPDHTRVFWIDAICINQNDEEEKTQQMQLMRDIYRNAPMTYLYIGGEDHTTAAVFKYLKTNSYVIRNGLRDNVITFNYHVAKNFWDAFRTYIMARPYFTRLWVVQEIIMCHFPVVKCGRHELAWDIFAAAWRITLQIPYQKPPGAFVWFAEDDMSVHYKSRPNLDTVEILESYRQERIRGTMPNLHFWLSAFRHKDCKDPRDKILGLLGLADDRLSTELAALGYHQSCSEIYTAVTRYNLSEQYALDEIIYSGEGQRGTDLPASWIPDYRQGGNLWQLSRNFYPPGQSYHASGKSDISKHPDAAWHRWEDHPIQQAPIFLSDTCIRVTGVLVDEIAQVEDEFDTNHRGDYIPSILFNGRRQYPLGDTYESNFARLITFGRDRWGARYPRSQFLIPFPRTLQKWERERLRGYCLFITVRGYIGLARSGPDGVRRDDEVCVLYGCSVPVVMRSKESGRKSLVCGWYVSSQIA